MKARKMNGVNGDEERRGKGKERKWRERGREFESRKNMYFH